MTFQQKFLIVVLLSTAVALSIAVTMRPVRSEQGAAGLGRFGVSAWLALMAIALLLVGVVSDTLLRHVIQIAPLALALAVNARGSGFGGAAALPLFTFWFLVMGGIWLFLLGIAPVFTGRYSPIEIVLTVVIGLASVCGLLAVFRRPTVPSLAPRVGTVLLFAILQPAAMLLSF